MAQSDGHRKPGVCETDLADAVGEANKEEAAALWTPRPLYGFVYALQFTDNVRVEPVAEVDNVRRRTGWFPWYSGEQRPAIYFELLHVDWTSFDGRQ